MPGKGGKNTEVSTVNICWFVTDELRKNFPIMIVQRYCASVDSVRRPRSVNVGTVTWEQMCEDSVNVWEYCLF
jgi:hypothetical protein